MTIKDIYTNKLYNYDRVQKNIICKRSEDKEMNKYFKYVVGGFVIVSVIGVVLFNNRTIEIDYANYLTANKPILEEKEKINNNITKLKKDYNDKKIEDEEYFNKLELLEEEKEKIEEKEEQLKKDYKLDKELNLDKVKFSDNKEIDKKLKEIYELKENLEARDEALDLKEDQLEKDYKAGKITKEEFITKKDAIEKEDEALDIEEDRLDALEDQYDIEEDDDLEDNDEDDDLDDDLDDNDSEDNDGVDDQHDKDLD